MGRSVEIAAIDVKDKLVFINTGIEDITPDILLSFTKKVRQPILDAGAKGCLVFSVNKLIIATADEVKDITLDDFMSQLEKL